ncbi:MAG TPA: hypothetical protein VGE09_06310 [Pseudoxanthomonas sp.]
MSKRFGRNQRRRMREALEQAQEELQRQHSVHVAVFEALNKRYADVQAQLSHVRECGAALVNSRVFPPEKVIERYAWPQRWDATPREAALEPVDGNAASRLVDATIVDLYEFGYTIERNIQETALLVHFFCEGRGELVNKWRYMISPRALLKAGFSHEARLRFAVDIGAQLVAAAEEHCRRPATTGVAQR